MKAKMMPQDRARIQTDRKLDSVEREISRVYKTYPALLAVEKQYAKYMATVKKNTDDAYKAYVNETDQQQKARKKEEYVAEIRRYTTNSVEYNSLVDKIAAILAQANQKALDVSNHAIREVYTINYNQVAEQCKRVGIKING